MLVSELASMAVDLCGLNYDSLPTDRPAKILNAFNLMLKSWGTPLQFATFSESFSLVVSQGVYSIGTSGDFNTTRPLKLLSAYIRDSAGIDHPVGVNMTAVEYNEIQLKATLGRPCNLHYKPTTPLAYIYFDTIPTDVETFYLTSYKSFTGYTALTDTIVQPIEYEKAMIYNLAVDIAPGLHQNLLPTVIEQSVILKNEILARNVVPLTQATFDSALLRGM